MNSKKCVACFSSFSLSKEDAQFLSRFEMPPPTHCPECRQQRRLAQINHTSLFKRKCDATGKNIISNYHSDSPYTVYTQDFWHSDGWDALEFGRDFDFSRPFFEQFAELSRDVPKPALRTAYEYDENSEYTNYCGANKDCYLIFDSDENRDCLYSYSINKSQNCMDCYRVQKCELCYESIDCLNCYNLLFSQDCESCNDSAFLKNCVGSRNCIMCVNLRNKEYYIKNKKVSKEEFEAFRKRLSSFSELQKMKKEFEIFQLQFPHKNLHGVKNENVHGEYLTNSKNAFYCFDSRNLWDCRYVYRGFNPVKDSMDVHEGGEAERLYECSVAGYNATNLQFCTNCLDQCFDMQYCDNCPHSSNLFGCVGMRKKEYCIFNKQYTKEEYESLTKKIIAHMQETKEWGEFFPMNISPFPYNETLAQEYFPLRKEEVLAQGLAWRDAEERVAVGVIKKISASQLPDTITHVPDDILNWAIDSEKKHPTGNQVYKIQRTELRLYRNWNLPLPREPWHIRHEKRKSMRNPQRLWERPCMKCEKQVLTAYSRDSSVIMYCEECYLKIVD